MVIEDWVEVEINVEVEADVTKTVKVDGKATFTIEVPLQSETVDCAASVGY